MPVRRDATHWRDEAAAALLVRHAPSLGLEGPALVVGEARAEALAALQACGLEPLEWHRRARSGRPAAPWPEGGPFRTVAVRLPRAGEEVEMTLHAALAVLVPHGRLLVYGARDEGIESAARRMEPLLGEVVTVASGGRCRLLCARRPPLIAGLRAPLSAWRETFSLHLPGLAASWVSYPGVFAHGRLDAGTRLLAGALPASATGARVLDFGCGSGVLGALVLVRSPGATVDFLDVDSVALEAVRENVPGSRAMLGEGLGAVAGERYDLILSNPPIHDGKAESLEVVNELVEVAPAHLSAGGELVLVAQRRLPLAGTLKARFRKVAAVADDGRIYRVWRASP